MSHIYTYLRLHGHIGPGGWTILLWWIDHGYPVNFFFFFWKTKICWVRNFEFEIDISHVLVRIGYSLNHFVDKSACLKYGNLIYIYIYTYIYIIV